MDSDSGPGFAMGGLAIRQRSFINAGEGQVGETKRGGGEE